MIKVGLTGGIGSGKTTVAGLFESHGVPIYNADTRAKKLMRSDQSLKQKIKKLLGSDSYYRNGYPNRPYIAKKIFTNKELLDKLNKLVHPAVKKDLRDWFYSQKNHSFAIYESAIIFDHGNEDDFDFIISVVCPIELRIKRIIKRDNSDAKTIQKRIDNQITDMERMIKSDFIIHNGEDNDLSAQVMNIYLKLNVS